MPIVYDASWYWSDGKAYRLYRYADLLRTARRASEILTISASSQAQIEALTRHQVPICPMPLGPGQFEGFEAAPAKDTQTILLMGRAAHKANELAAELLVQSSLVQREFRVVAVWVSSATERILREGMSPSQIHIHDALSASRLAEVFTQADRYVALGNSEGFGFPYVEAAYFGCDVIAPRIALTSEVLGEEGNYLSSSHPTVHELEGAILAWDENRVGRMQRVSAQRTWKHTALAVAQRIRAHFGESH
jgi:glycosyltransferase involved in cell wall biosynthesis